MLIELQNIDLQDVLHILLRDWNTGKNIIWATDDYKKYGPEYYFDCEMTSYSVNNIQCVGNLQPRVSKSKELQKSRTKGKAEVFTPSAICNDMNTYCDLDWFNIKEIDINGNIPFIFDKKKTLKGYVSLKKLEITCGEAPFVVSRYDTTTGEIIPLYERIGFLDRKLFAISLYTKDIDKKEDDDKSEKVKKEEWLKLCYRAYESCYGYEYQGDNLLKARINLFYTFIDYYERKWGVNPPRKTLEKIANIISKNFWQMDGLTYSIPNTDIKCKVYNWRSKKNMNIVGEGSMKFDFVIGNPPYQEKDGGGIASAVPLYHKFINESKKISDNITMVIPSRWMTGGKGLDEFRNEMIHDTHLRVLHDYANSKEVFSGVDIKGGVCYFNWDKKYNGVCDCYRHNVDGVSFSQRFLCEDGDDIFIRESILIGIKKKVNVNKDNSVSNIVSNRMPYGITADFFKNYKKYQIEEIFENPFEDSYTVLGLLGRGRDFRYIHKDSIEIKNEGLNKYKLFIPKAYGCGNIGEIPSTPVLGTPVLGTPGMLCTETFLQIGPFDTEFELKNFLTYYKTKFFRTLVSIKKQTQNTTQSSYQFVPLQNFTEKSDINWFVSVSEIDKQLYNKYGLDEKEIAFIEEKVKEME